MRGVVLPEDAVFGIVVYSESYKAWEEDLVAANARGKKKAHAFVDGIEGNGTTNISDSLDRALDSGADTIFLLSDGAPSWDDFGAVDKDYGEDEVVVDLEYKEKVTTRDARLEYHGPYLFDEWLVDDVRRMNAFRRIRMHCIGLGEANMGLLRKLAEMGHGEVFAVGDGKGGRAPERRPVLRLTG